MIDAAELASNVKEAIKTATGCWGICFGITPEQRCNCEVSARAAIAAAAPSIRAGAMQEVIQMLAARDDLMDAVKFRHVATAIHALKEKS